MKKQFVLATSVQGRKVENGTKRSEAPLKEQQNPAVDRIGPSSCTWCGPLSFSSLDWYLQFNMDTVLPIFFELREESPTLITDIYPPLTRDGASLVLTACIMMVLTTLWTILRLVSRRITGISFHMEEYLYFSGQVCLRQE